MENEFDEPFHDLALDTLALTDPDSAIVGYIWTSMRPDPTRDRVIIVSGRVHPDWTRLGLGRSLISWAIDRSHARPGQHSDTLPKIIRAYTYEEDVATVRAYESCGFGPDRYFVELTRDLTTPIRSINIAEGVVVTPWTSAVDDATRTIHNEAFVDHWGSEPITEERWRRWLSHNEAFLPDASFVACVGNAIVGYSMNCAYPQEWEDIGHSEGWIVALGTARTWRKQGIASALVEASLRAFKGFGYHHAALGVDMENPSGALGLYTQHGFVPTRREVSFSLPIGDG